MGKICNGRSAWSRSQGNWNEGLVIALGPKECIGFGERWRKKFQARQEHMKRPRGNRVSMRLERKPVWLEIREKGASGEVSGKEVPALRHCYKDLIFDLKVTGSHWSVLSKERWSPFGTHDCSGCSVGNRVKEAMWGKPWQATAEVHTGGDVAWTRTVVATEPRNKCIWEFFRGKNQ